MRCAFIATLLLPLANVSAEIPAPRPAEIAAHATKALLLDITRAGSATIAVGDHGIVLRSEDGKAWTQQPSPVDVMLNRVRFLDARQGWIAGHDGVLLHTADGGRSWQLQQYDPEAGKPYFDVRFSDALHGWLLGGDGRLLRSDDGGASWTEIDSPAFASRPHLYALCVTGSGAMLLVGERGFVARSMDRGQSWAQLKSPYTGAFFGAQAVGATSAVIFGLRGRAFEIADVATLPVLGAAEAAAIEAAALDPEQAMKAAQNPVSDVTGWTLLRSEERNALFGSVGGDNGLLLVGGSGRVQQVDLKQHTLTSLPQPMAGDASAGVLSADGKLITVGTAGLQASPFSHLWERVARQGRERGTLSTKAVRLPPPDPLPPLSGAVGVTRTDISQSSPGPTALPPAGEGKQTP